MGTKKKNCAGPRPRTLQLLSMDELRSRPCEVDGRPALFHRWVEEDRVLTATNGLGHYIPGTPAINVIRETFALVEYRDGTVAKVKPELVRFEVGEG